ncbi:MAG TPA: beta-galactosidase, partial [Chitinophagaceae bacterium]
GTKTDGFLFTFKKIAWTPGTISAIGYDKNGKQVCATSKMTAGSPTAIRLKAITHPKGLQANGHDLALVEVEVVDAKGNRCPTALNMINFSLAGEAEWRGGIAQGPDNYILSKDLPVECGVNRVFVRSTTKAGPVTITAKAEGLKSATITLLSKPVANSNGLSTVLPASGLTSYLKRGPTPKGTSFKVLRESVKIVSATAGANADSAFASFDDNELSDWVNNGQLSTAWIEYELEKEAVVTEVALKLNNFRSRTYPLRITVDGKEAFADTTTRSLGYFTAICKPQKGKKVRIQLATLSKDQAGEIMAEVSGKKLDDGVTRDDKNAKGTLSIIEAEIYEKPKQ